MATVIHRFDPPERFVAGTVGPPGQRTFFLQARSGTRVMRIPHGEGITGTVAKTQDPVLVGDVSKDERFVPGEIASGCEMAAPMLFRGELIGVLDAASPVPWAFSQRDLELLAGFAASAAIALRNAKRFGEERASSRPPET